MIKWTTPQITLILDKEVSGTFTVSLEQLSNEVTIDDSRITSVVSDGTTTLTFSLTQNESGVFTEGLSINVQVNFMDGDYRGATDIATVPTLRNLIDEVME